MRNSVNQSNNKRVVVIGGGPAGLTASYELVKTGIKCVVLEKDKIVGGISRTVNYKDYYFDIGGHRFFTKIDRVEDLWKEVLGNDFLVCKRLSRIYYNSRFFYYPLKPVNALLGLGIWNCFLVLASYIKARFFPIKEEDTFEQWVSNRFGKRLYQIFFKTYTEKVWGIKCNEIRAEWAAQRIKGLSLVTAIKNALIPNKNTSSGKKNVVATLIDQFHYPKYGPGMMWETVSNKISANGSEVLMGAEVTSIICSHDIVEAVEIKRDGDVEQVSGTDFISSMPLQAVIQRMKPPVPEAIRNAAENLKYRDFLTVALIIDKEEVFPDNWIYIHDPEVEVGRIQNFKNWSQYMVPDESKTCLGLEYFCFEGDSFWTKPDSELVDLATNEIENLGFAKKEQVLDGTVVRMPKAYPVYDSKYKESVELIKDYLKGISNLQLIGRNGQHKYNNQDHSMLTGMMAAENVTGADNNLWEVNEDQEYHEEIIVKALERVFGRIDKLGLATALGSVSGILLFLATLILVLKGGEIVGPRLQLLDQYFIGYSVTLKGAFIGLIYTFIWGFIFGWLIAYIRNFFVAFYIYMIKKRAEKLMFKDFLDHF